jgi:hypothetical protein
MELVEQLVCQKKGVLKNNDKNHMLELIFQAYDGYGN